MIARVRLGRAGLETSRLGFGTSRLHHLEAAGRARILETAIDLGLTHIDTAPAYGDTLSEREVGRVLKARRSGIVIATKYGVPPDPVIASALALAFPLRVGRAMLRKAGLKPSARPPMTPAGLRASIEASLRRLATDWIDALLLHEPDPTVLVDIAGIGDELERLRTAGLIRSYGLAGPWAGLAALGEQTGKLGDIVQTGEMEWIADAPPDITYGAISRGPQSFANKAIDPILACTRLRDALARRPKGVVLVSTSDPTRLRALAEVAQMVTA